jgi:hypothetical protein
MKKIKLSFLFIGLFSLWVNIGLAGWLPDTDQIYSYTNTYGEDSDYIINAPSYTKLDNQGNELSDSAASWVAVRDNLTGLTWEIKTILTGSIHDEGNQYSWQDAQDVFIAQLNAINFAGFSDWRLPSLKEIYTIHSADTLAPGINPDYFGLCCSGVYWTSTTVATSTTNAWSTDISNGDEPWIKTKSILVRAVRGPQYPEGNFTDNLDGTVTDNGTGLMWQQDKSAIKLIWDASLTYCENLMLAGYGDWRLPNVIELRSIIDYTTFDPAIDPAYFSDEQFSQFWSSTSWFTSGSQQNRAWALGSSYDGMFHVGYDKDSPFRYARCLREGIPPTVTATNPVNGATGVAVDTTITATFSEDMDASTITTSTFVVNDGSGNIAGTVTYGGTTATFTPTINLDYDTGYSVTITNGAQDLLGNSLQTDYIWSFATPDLVPPVVNATNPANGATDVALNSSITATFSEPMDASTITTSTFVVNDGSGNIAGTVTYAGTTATFTPPSSLDFDTTYTGTITTGVEDLTGNQLQAGYLWSFTTISDTTPPTVTSTNPFDSATDVAVNATVSATFSEAIDVSTLTASTFLVDDGTSYKAGTVSYAGTTATFTPSSNFDYNTTYTAAITTGVEDLASNPLQADHTWSFTTGSAPDTITPVVNSASPADNATGIAVNTSIIATFSEAMDAATITNSNFTVNGGAGNLPGTVTYSGTTAKFTPAANFAYYAVYTATITTGVEDLAGNALETDYNWSFTAGSGSDSIAPTVISIDPENTTIDVAVDTAISANFSEPIDPISLTTSNFLVNDGTGSISGTVTVIGNTATFTPTATLNYDTEYSATLTSGIEDLAGNTMGTDYAWSFTTQSENSGGIQKFGGG